MKTTPAYNIPANFTGVVTRPYGAQPEICLACVNGTILRGAKGGLRKFKTEAAAAKAAEEAAR